MEEAGQLVCLEFSSLIFFCSFRDEMPSTFLIFDVVWVLPGKKCGTHLIHDVSTFYILRQIARRHL